MKDIFSILTELRIKEAIARGDFKNLSGSGKPLNLEGLYFLPRKLRAAYIVLKNSDYLNQPTMGNNRCSSSVTRAVNLPDMNPSMTQQQLSEKIYYHHVMMDCIHRR